MAKANPHPSLQPKVWMGFHGLKELLTTTSYLPQHCEFLASNVRIVAQITRAVAALFLRSGKELAYLNLHRPDEVNLDGLTDLEDKYERAMFKKWSKEDGSPESGWHRLIEYQVPVFDRRSSPLGLRAIDLLAISQRGFPVIVELKVLSLGTQADTPLRALLEAVAYACVLQADWPAFRKELIERIKVLGIQNTPPDELTECPVVVAAPQDYWTFWNNPERKSFLRAKRAFRSFVQAFQANGFPTSFVTVEGQVDDYQHLQARRISFLDD